MSAFPAIWFDYGRHIEPEHDPEFKWQVRATQDFYRLAYDKESHDCAVRALAVSCAAPYGRAHNAMTKAGRIPGHPSNISMMLNAATKLGHNMVRLFKKPGPTLLTAERALAATHGGFILITCDHAVGLWNGELIDHLRGTLKRVEFCFRLEERK